MLHEISENDRVDKKDEEHGDNENETAVKPSHQETHQVIKTLFTFCTFAESVEKVHSL